MNKIFFLILLGIVSNAARAQSEDRADSVKTEGNEIYMIVEETPQPKGGFGVLTEFIKKNMKKPASVRRGSVSGQVFVSFIVRKDGTLTDASIVKGVDPDCDKEALRLISIMEPWNPGKQGGKILNVRFVLPIRFQ
jgi:periplasmic protein TonB